MEFLEWIERTLKPEAVTSVDFMYEEMESQSAFCLPVIYQPFDAAKRSHWRDRGWLFDFLYATRCERKRVLDFGPGDGWPSLIIAPHVRSVTGVDGSQRRVSACEGNARRLGSKNVQFIHVAPGKALPFEDDTFDSVVTASAVEQTPDPEKTIRECFRVLKPGGRLRILYESLSAYENGKEREIFFDSDEAGRCVLTIYDRRITEELAHMYKIRWTKSCREVFPLFLEREKCVEDISFETLSKVGFERFMPSVMEVKKCALIHPCGETLVRWLYRAGFREVIPSQNGAAAAGRLFDTIPVKERPRSVEAVDALLKPVVKEVIERRAEITEDPPLTAIK